MQQPQRPVFTRGFTSGTSLAPTPTNLSPAVSNPGKTGTMHVKRVTLTSKKNWWMGEQTLPALLDVLSDMLQWRWMRKSPQT
jgi:hypothetical protein